MYFVDIHPVSTNFSKSANSNKLQPHLGYLLSLALKSGETLPSSSPASSPLFYLGPRPSFDRFTALWCQYFFHSSCVFIGSVNWESGRSHLGQARYINCYTVLQDVRAGVFLGGRRAIISRRRRKVTSTHIHQAACRFADC